MKTTVPGWAMALFFIVLLAAFGEPAPARSTPADVRFGIVAFDLNGPVPPRLLDLGVGLIRGSCPWGALEPARGVFDWTCSDNFIVGAQRFGWWTYMTVVCTPAWANASAGCFEMPSDLDDWYQFAARFIDRYARYHTVLGVWNEPNLALQERASSTNYVKLFTTASEARNRVAPLFRLAGPEVSHHALANGYYARVMDLTRAARAWAPQDIVSVHWYGDGPPLPSYIDAVDSLAGSQEVWLSETGSVSTDPEAQAQFFTSVLTEFAAPGRPWWTHVIFYRLWDGQDCCTEAILRADFAPKPAYSTYQSWIGDQARRRPWPPPLTRN